MDNLTPDDTLPGGNDIVPADGNGTATSDDVVELKDVLNSALKKAPGQEFKTNEDALKAVTDTFAYVNKAGWHKKAIDSFAQARGLDEKSAVKLIMENTITPEAKAPVVEDKSQFVSREEYDREMFFSKNPDYDPYKGLLTDLQKAQNKPLSEIVQSDTFKSVFEKAKAHDVNEKTKSVIMSNSRLGQVTDKMTEAHDAAKAANEASLRGDTRVAEKSRQQAELSATKAVMEAFNIA